MKLLWPDRQARLSSRRASSIAIRVTAYIGLAGVYVGLAIVALTVFQFREKLARILTLKVLKFSSIDCAPEECANESLVSAWALFGFLFCALVVASFVFSQGFRKQVLQLSALVGILLGLGTIQSYFFPQASELWFLLAANLIQALFVAFPAGGESRADDGAPSPRDGEPGKRHAGARATALTLGIAWAGVLTLGLTFWIQLGPPVERDPWPEHATGLSPPVPGIPKAAEPWLSAIEAGDLTALRGLAAQRENLAVFADPVWGKFLFFRAADAGPPALKFLLSLRVIPVDVLGDGRRRLASTNNCEGLRAIHLFAERQRPPPAWSPLPCGGTEAPRNLPR